MVCAVLVVISWPILHGKTTGLPFWLCLGGLPFLACTGFLAFVLQFHAMAVFYTRCWNQTGRTANIAWQRWSRRHVVLRATSTLTPTTELAEKIAGLAGSAPQNRTEVLKLKGFDSDLSASRTQMVFERLLDDLKADIRAAATGAAMHVMTWAGEGANPDDISRMARAAWKSLDLPLCAVFSARAQIEWSSVGQHALRRSTPLLILCAQLHENGDALAAFSESAVALLFDQTPARQRGNQPVVRVYRPMPTSIVTMRADLEQFGEVGPFRLGQIRTAWNCALGKAEGFALVKAVADAGLVLDGAGSGTVSLSGCIGPAGPVCPWLSLGLAAELVRYGQGPQLLAIAQGRDVELTVAAAGPPVPVPQSGHAAGADLRGAALLVCVAPWLVVLIGVLFETADLFPWIVAGVFAAGAFAVLFMLAHPLLVRARAARDVLAAGGRMPARGQAGLYL